MWPFRRKNPAAPPERNGAPPAPPGDGWRRWFELSIRAAHDPPWRYEWVELWRSNWERPRVTRSADIPYELDGEGFWWRPARSPRHGPEVIEGIATPVAPAPDREDG
ncbi:MAG TPA: hypothetical protein VKZ79_04630 [Alphaproteobacteria bacterium]|nr:hypothetical protein [Alphaproteobacteria bacterium]